MLTQVIIVMALILTNGIQMDLLPTTPSLREQGWWESEYDESITYPRVCSGGG